ncbi:MAG: flavin reductase family protein [Clostridia bacterium]|nr:flavin reductase family protein [Clostridia bacterium]
MTLPTRIEIPYEQIAQATLERMGNGGLFLTTCAEPDKPNTMTIGWGGMGSFFGRPVFYVPVRTSRYTFGLLKKSGEFTVSVPLHDMSGELLFAGTVSGRDTAKFEGHGLTAVQAWDVSAPIVAECERHFECRVFASAAVNEGTVPEAMLARWYPDRDMHTLFFGEILRCYDLHSGR